MSTTFFPKVIPEIDAKKTKNCAQKKTKLHTPALLLLRRPPCWNKRGATRTTRRMCRVET